MAHVVSMESAPKDLKIIQDLTCSGLLAVRFVTWARGGCCDRKTCSTYLQCFCRAPSRGQA